LSLLNGYKSKPFEGAVFAAEQSTIGETSMTLHQLKILMAVAKYLNFRKAAEELHLSQPSLFVQFKNLESEYDLKLYKRNGRGIELTRAGKEFLTYAGEILAKVENLDEAFRRTHKGYDGGILRICSSYGPSIAFLPNLLAKFRMQHPNTRIAFLTDDSQAAERMVLDNEIDLGFITQPSSSPSIQYQHCREETIVAFGSPKHLSNPPLTLFELSRTPLVLCTSRVLQHETEGLLKTLKDKIKTPNVVMQCDSPEGLKTAVKMGVGIGFLYWDAVEPEISRGELMFADLPELNLRADTVLAYRKDKPLNVHARDFLALLHHEPLKRGNKKARNLPTISPRLPR
jgi:DNA-binding transcriptional LysR family regulator